MIKVVVVDDHLVVAETLAVTLADHGDIVVVGIAQSGEQGIDLISKLNPDVAVIDFRLPDMSGSEVIRQLTDRGQCMPLCCADWYGPGPGVFGIDRSGCRRIRYQGPAV